MTEVMKRLQKQLPGKLDNVNLQPEEVAARYNKCKKTISFPSIEDFFIPFYSDAECMSQLSVFLTLRTVIAGVLETYVMLDR